MGTALAFTVAKARLGLHVMHIREVLPALNLVQPPEMPRMLRGFVNLEGTLIPVIRLERIAQLDMQRQTWEPEGDLNATIIVTKLQKTEVAWMADGDVEILRYTPGELVRLPRDHVLNNCAEQVIARTPPAPSIVMLDPARLLLEAERQRITQLAEREQERLAEL